MANFNKDKKYHFIYKTTNKLNDEYYIGMHSTNNIKDGYVGSGKRLRRSLNKYGKENFTFEIIEYCESRELLAEREKTIVNEELISNKNCLNISVGGIGGWRNENQKNNFMMASKKRLMELRKNSDWCKMHSNRVKEGLVNISYNHANFNGKSHSIETKEKVRRVRIERGLNKPEMNSQYGICWITNGCDNKKIIKGHNIPDGWKLGRVIKIK